MRFTPNTCVKCSRSQQSISIEQQIGTYKYKSAVLEFSINPIVPTRN